MSISPEDAAAIRPFIKERNVTFTVLTDPTGNVSLQKYQASEIPRNLLLDKQGRIVSDLVGYDEEAFQSQIVDRVPQLLAEK